MLLVVLSFLRMRCCLNTPYSAGELQLIYMTDHFSTLRSLLLTRIIWTNLSCRVAATHFACYLLLQFFFHAPLPFDLCSSFSFASLVSWFHCTLSSSHTKNLKLRIVELIFEFAARFSSCVKWKFDFSFITLSSILAYLIFFPVLGFTLVLIS